MCGAPRKPHDPAQSQTPPQVASHRVAPHPRLVCVSAVLLQPRRCRNAATHPLPTISACLAELGGHPSRPVCGRPPLNNTPSSLAAGVELRASDSPGAKHQQRSRSSRVPRPSNRHLTAWCLCLDRSVGPAQPFAEPRQVCRGLVLLTRRRSEAVTRPAARVQPLREQDEDVVHMYHMPVASVASGQGQQLSDVDVPLGLLRDRVGCRGRRTNDRAVSVPHAVAPAIPGAPRLTRQCVSVDGVPITCHIVHCDSRPATAGCTG